MRVVRLVYDVVNAFPESERYGLSQQMRRAAVSAPSNIAEGFARSSRKELLQFLSISLGSLSELDTQLQIAHELGFVAQPQALQAALDEAHRDIVNLRFRLKASIGAPQRARSIGA
jgi:four helix bundle protein